MWASTIAAAWGKVRFYAAAACQVPPGEVDPLKLETMREALTATDGFSQAHPPLLGVCGTAKLEGPDGHLRDEPVVWLLTGRVRHAAAKALGLALPIYPLEPEALDAAVAAGLIDAGTADTGLPSPDDYKVKDELALSALWAGGSFGIAGELLGARDPEIDPAPAPTPEPEQAPPEFHVDKASDDAEEPPA